MTQKDEIDTQKGNGYTTETGRKGQTQLPPRVNSTPVLDGHIEYETRYVEIRGEWYARSVGIWVMGPEEEKRHKALVLELRERGWDI